jgi:hypothetical protein
VLARDEQVPLMRAYRHVVERDVKLGRASRCLHTKIGLVEHRHLGGFEKSEGGGIL